MLVYKAQLFNIVKYFVATLKQLKRVNENSKSYNNYLPQCPIPKPVRCFPVSVIIF